ncbi:peroxiredoxin type-2 [Asimina triloba]
MGRGGGLYDRKVQFEVLKLTRKACIKLQGKGSYPGKHSKERGMEVGQLQRHWVDLMTSLFREVSKGEIDNRNQIYIIFALGLLDDQYTQLQQLQDESNPDFVFEVVSLFFDDSEKLLNELTGVLNEQPLDFKKVDAHVHQLKGSSSSIGAQRVKNVCIAFRSFCEAKNHEG